jgi:hypothetical protein
VVWYWIHLAQNWEVPEWLSDWQLLKKDIAVWS